jgi:solute carrier family 25 protein 39/40
MQWLTLNIHFRIIGVPSSTCYMLTYDHLLRVVLPPLVPYESLIPLTAGILARTSITSLASPLELIRTNLQSTPKSANNPHTLRSVLTSVRGLVQAQGIQSLWRGLGPSLWRDVPFSGIYWASYEWWKKVLERRGRSGAWAAFVSGAVSGTTAALITSPFDVLKTRRQALIMSTVPSVRTSTGTLPLLMKIMRTEGASALFAGILPRTAKIAPACGIMISCFEVGSRSIFPKISLTNPLYQGVGRFLEKKHP